MKFDRWLFGKGMLMGAADIVPGVSGGTIAFITGIYETLVYSIRKIVPEFFSLLSHKQLPVFWRQINGTFLLTLLGGILSSVILLSNLIVYLLANSPIPLWSFFFGLIVASAIFVSKDVNLKKWANVLLLLVGIVVAFVISRMVPGQVEPGLLIAFGSGAIAICAMILPGISGSFILVLIGSYAFILEAVQTLDVAVLAVFAGGCLIGLLSIANLLAWAFAHYRQSVLAVLTGFMIGALDKVWPWKETLSYRTNRHGELVPLSQSNVSPFDYQAIASMDPQIAWSLMFTSLAIISVFGLERVSRSKP